MKARNSSAEMPFLDHLEELRWRILWSLLALVVAAGGMFVVVTKYDVIGLLKAPLDPYIQGERLIYLGVTDPFMITIQLAIVAGLILSAPILLYHVWSFLSPALLPRERRAIVPALYLGLVLFAGGVSFAYFLALPYTIRFMLGFQTESLAPNITAGFYFSFVTKMLVAFGAIFEMPVVVLVLSAIGLVTSGFLRSKRRYAVAIMAVASAAITPGDAITLTVFMMAPLMLLYEFSIMLARLVERGRARALAAEALPEAT